MAIVPDSGPLLLPHGGVYSGRADTGFGTNYSFTLGSFIERYDDVAVGDYGEVTQDVDVTSVDVIGFRLGLRGVDDGFPDDMLVLGRFNDLAGQSFDLDYIRDGGTPTILKFGSPEIVWPGVLGFGNGAIEIGNQEGVQYDGDNVVSGLIQAGCVPFRLKPGYSGTPSDHQYFYTSGVRAAPSQNAVTILHMHTTGLLVIGVNDSSGSVIIFGALGAWSPSAGTWYDLELNFNVGATGLGAGESRLFVDGTQFGSTQTGTGTRSDSSDFIIVGADPATDPYASNYTLDELHVYNATKHTASFTPPTAEYGSANWRFRVFAGANELYRVEFGSGIDANFIERAVNVSTLTGTQTLKFRLEAL